MPLFAATSSRPGCWPITVGAEGIAAAQFARCGFDVLVQAGHDKPWYDLTVTKGGNLLKIVIKGSDDGHWRLVHSYIKRSMLRSGAKTDAEHAVDLWLDIHGSTRTVYCLVQFEGVTLNGMPRIYLATPGEIARRLRESAERLGEPVLYEEYEWDSPGTGFTTIETLPSSWLFSPDRIHELLFPQAANAIPLPAVRKNNGLVEVNSKASDRAGESLREAALMA